MNNQNYLGSSLFIISLNAELSNMNNKNNSKSFMNNINHDISKEINNSLPIIK